MYFRTIILSALLAVEIAGVSAIASSWGNLINCRGPGLKVKMTLPTELPQTRREIPGATMVFSQNGNMSLGMKAIVRVSVVCADTENKAHKLFKEYRAKIVDEGPALVGSPEQIRLEVLKLQLDYQVDEIIVRTLIVDPIERLNSYRLFSDVCGLKPGRHALKSAA